MKPYLQDADLTLYCGDVLEVLRELPDESVDCCVTSPPYWRLRDYGTGEWEGGDDECDHLGKPFRTKATLNENWGAGFSDVKNAEGREPMRQECSKCGARRVDHQLGLEATPDLYVERMVEVFREVRRVLAEHGTCWLNLGDSYASKARGSDEGWDKSRLTNPGTVQKAQAASLRKTGERHRGKRAGIKEKDLVMIPAEVALALRADGWYLRSEIVWAKPNPMPESVTDRPTKAHEMVYLLTKSPRYFFDQEAVRESAEWNRWGEQTSPKHGESDQSGARWLKSKKPDGWDTGEGGHGSVHRNGREKGVPTEVMARGRNVRTVWEIPTRPFPEAHFATYPEELVRRCILAGCPEQVCRVCGKPRGRIVERERVPRGDSFGRKDVGDFDHGQAGTPYLVTAAAETIGWTSCDCSDYRSGIVLDPFMGSGTTALVARKHGRHAVGIELSPDYCAMAAKRLSQLSLLTESGAA